MAEELIEYYTERYLTLCDKIKKPIPESVLKAVEKTRHIPECFYLNSVVIKDFEDFMNKVIVTFHWWIWTKWKWQCKRCISVPGNAGTIHCYHLFMIFQLLNTAKI